MQVCWTPRAQADLNDQIDYIAQDNLQAANRMRMMIYEHTQLLEKTPDIGRAGSVADTRELILSGTPYLAVYRVKEEFVEILRLLHGAQQYPLPARSGRVSGQ